PNARAREIQEDDLKAPEEEFELGGIEDSDDDIELEPISIFDNDEDDFEGKELFGDDALDDDDDLGDKFTLFDSEDEDDGDKE
ncbi:MAG: hypothetical protein K2N33_00050, partial [Clostridia bacterium]|nr:hypothetical protein [Clostridia bacterium]